jgi:hypothetical protein
MNSLQALKRQNTRKTPKKRWQNRGQLPATLNQLEPFGAVHFGAE